MGVPVASCEGVVCTTATCASGHPLTRPARAHRPAPMSPLCEFNDDGDAGMAAMLLLLLVLCTVHGPGLHDLDVAQPARSGSRM